MSFAVTVVPQLFVYPTSLVNLNIVLLFVIFVLWQPQQVLSLELLLRPSWMFQGVTR